MSYKLVVLGGVLLSFGFVVPPLWWLVFFGIAPLIKGIQGARSNKEAFFLGWLGGFVFYCLGYFAIWWFTLPLNWFGFFAMWFQVTLVGFSWALSMAGLALPVGIFALFVRSVKYSWLNYISIACMWVLCEWASAWLFSLQNAGQGVMIGPHFALASLGTLLANDSVLLQLAWIGGVYLLSASVVLVGLLLYQIFFADEQAQKKYLTIGLVLAMLWIVGQFVLPHISPNTQGKPFSVAAVSLQKPPIFVPTQQQDNAAFNVILKALFSTRGTSLVVLPESANFLRTLRTEAGKGSQNELAEIYGSSMPPVIVDSESIYDSDRILHDRLAFYSVESDSSTFRNKQFLLPGGEYIPYLYQPLFSAMGQNSELQLVLERRGFSSATTSSPVLVGDISVGALFCSEAMSPLLYSSLAAQGAEVFVNLSSQNWYHGSKLVAAEMKDVAKIRATESRRWYIQASDVSQSFVLDPYGRVVSESAWGSEGVLNAEVYAMDETTPYTIFAFWIPFFLLFFLSTVWFSRNFR